MCLIFSLFWHNLSSIIIMKKFIMVIIINLIGNTMLSQTPEEVLLKKEIILPLLPPALGNYTNIVKSGNLLYLSGRGPLKADGTYVVGKIGKELNIQDGYTAARLCAVAQLALLKSELGRLSKVRRIVKVTGFVNSTDTFTDQPKVINGFSDLIAEVFGANGIHARSAVSVASLPAGWPVEIEMIVEIEE